jgi:hypothetical protein
MASESKILIRDCTVGALALFASAGLSVAQDNGRQIPANRPVQQIQTRNSVAGFREVPWFSHPVIRRKLNLTQDEYQRLNDAYTQAWQTYQNDTSTKNQNIKQLLAEQQDDLYDSFNVALSNGADDVITDPSARQRYNQLYWQYRGFDAFSDPVVFRRLNLSDKQRSQFDAYNRKWNETMVTLSKSYLADRGRTTGSFNRVQAEAQEQVNLALSQAQKAEWRKIAGPAYAFPADVYLTPQPAVR